MFEFCLENSHYPQRNGNFEIKRVENPFQISLNILCCSCCNAFKSNLVNPFQIFGLQFYTFSRKIVGKMVHSWFRAHIQPFVATFVQQQAPQPV